MRRRRLNICAALFALHLPAFAFATVGNGKSDETALLFMLPFFGTVIVALDWQVPVELRKRRDVRVRERWRLELANGDWMLAGWEIRSADLT